jgi:hypothetical protein
MEKSATNKSVIIGVAGYPAPISKLHAVAADVKEIAKVLKSKNGEFSKSGTFVLADRKATKVEIESVLKNAFIAAKADTVFVYCHNDGFKTLAFRRIL